MKKILSFLTVCAVAMSISFTSNAQIKFGIKGGLNLTNLTGDPVADIKDALSTYTGFNVGVALNVGLPFGFAIQPEVLYNQTGMKFKESLPLFGDISALISVGAIQVPVGIQWGVELGPIRPYIQAVPYISFPVSHVAKVETGGAVEKSKLANDIFSSFDYGVGVGAGVDLWKLQASVRYNWALGSFVKTDQSNAQEVIGDLVDEMSGAKLSGLEISLALFF